MKLAIVLAIVALLVLAGCAQKQEAPVVEETKCLPMKNVNTGDLDCFSCAGQSCAKASREGWRVLDESVIATGAVSCEKVDNNCVLKQN